MNQLDFLGKIFNEIDKTLSLDKATIPVDIKKIDNGIEFYAYVPGVKREDISISVEDYSLSISVKAKEIPQEDLKKWVYIESLSNFQKGRRVFDLTKNLDLESISASLNDGILVIKFMNKEKTNPTKIDIEIK